MILKVSFALAETELFNSNGFSTTFSFEASVYAIQADDVNFGSGQFDIISEETRSSSITTFEAYIKPVLESQYISENTGTFYAGLGIVAGLARGEGDPGGFVTGNEEDVSTEYLFAGWRSGSLPGSSEDLIDLSFGRQEFQIGDGFLIWDGNLDQFEKGNYWTTPRNSFENTAILRINSGPLRADIFYLTTDKDQDNTELIGFNLEKTNEESGSTGFSLMQIIDSDERDYVRDGMSIVSLRSQGNPFEKTPDLFLAGEYVRQSGGDETNISADGWYAEAAYTFSDISWSPTLSYRYSHFSGDNPDTDKYEGFDPLFYGFSRGWGSWFQGEIVGEYLLFNSNQRTHMLQLSVEPTESMGGGLIYFQFDLDEKNYYGEPVSDRTFADEINLYVDWAPNDYLEVGALYGIAIPKEAAKTALGGNEAFQIIEIYTTFYF
ncbi:MAG: alginate export family protein [Gammaproteobacteria bacterium]